MTPTDLEALRESALAKMRHIMSPEWVEEHGKDTEAAHIDADYILSELLIDLGFEELIAAYRAIEKWYA